MVERRERPGEVFHRAAGRVAGGLRAAQAYVRAHRADERAAYRTGDADGGDQPGGVRTGSRADRAARGLLSGELAERRDLQPDLYHHAADPTFADRAGDRGIDNSGARDLRRGDETADRGNRGTAVVGCGA